MEAENETKNRSQPPISSSSQKAVTELPTKPHAERPAAGSQTWGLVQMIGSLVLTVCLLGYLMLGPAGKSPSANDHDRPVMTEPVKAISDRLIQIQGGHAIEKKLQIATVTECEITVPLLTVTGTVAASLRPKTSQATNNWQFNSPEALTTYTDWQRAQNEIGFTEKRLATVRDLVDAKVRYQKDYETQVVALGTKGSMAEHTIKKVKLDTIEAQLDGQKDIYEAENALRLARRTESSLALQLEQAGLEPELLTSATPDMDIVMADVPLGSLSYVKLDQKCKATFVGVRGQVFDGKVNKIVPVISKDQRSLRVLFVIHDPDDLLRPGMLAEIELGTDPRQAMLAPAEGVVHVGRSDYFLVAAETPGQWRVTEVRIGEPFKTEVEVFDGLHAGDRVLGRGAILLKPVVVRSLNSSSHVPTGAAR